MNEPREQHLIPKSLEGPKSDFEQLGLTFNESSDDGFYLVELPEGWYNIQYGGWGTFYDENDEARVQYDTRLRTRIVDPPKNFIITINEVDVPIFLPDSDQQFLFFDVQPILDVFKIDIGSKGLSKYMQETFPYGRFHKYSDNTIATGFSLWPIEVAKVYQLSALPDEEKKEIWDKLTNPTNIEYFDRGLFERLECLLGINQQGMH